MSGIADQCLACTDGGVGWADLNFCGQLSGTQRYWCSDPDTSPNRCAGDLYAWPKALGNPSVSVGPVLVPEPSTLGTSTKVTPSSGPTSAVSPSTSVPPNTSVSPTPPSRDSSLSVAIGVAVGVPLGVLALGIFGYLFIRERRKTMVRDMKETMAGDMSMAPQPGGYPVESVPEVRIQPPEVASEQEVGGSPILELGGAESYG
ncbi:MAG: hypothetical protein M1813_003720 [Trichoglossum hirsutum]|jgi:hypothetical protein|nr:MAG: hypothetical protein M1813_003720 [Trichoglossum hirsutum]